MLFKQYAGILMAICQRYACDQSEAEDMMQEAFTRIFLYISQYHYSGSFAGWVKRITVHAAIKVLQRKKIKFIEITNIQSEFYASDPDVFSDLGADDLLKLISELPDGYRLVFNLYALEGYTHDEIAGMLKIKTATSRSQLSKARVMLKEKINLFQKIPG
jgi:RNA polymerase sigma factor (sigma-70 family)